MEFKKIVRAMFSLLMAAIMLVGAASYVSAVDGNGDTPAESAESDSVVTEYSVRDASGTHKSKVIKGDKVNIEIRIKNLQLTQADIAGGVEKGIVVVRPIDSFGGSGSPVIIDKSQNSSLEYIVVFTGLTYSGDGQSLTFYLTYPTSGIAKEQLTVTVKQCVEYTEPATKEQEPTAADSETPLVIVGRGALPANLKQGEAFTMPVTFTNMSQKVAISSGIASFEPSDGLIVAESSASKQVSEIAPGATLTVALKLSVAKNAESAAQSVAVSYKFSYRATDGSTQQETETEKLNVPVVIPAKAAAAKTEAGTAAPNIIISSYSYGDPVAAGEAFKLNLSFKNTSKNTGIENIVMSIETGASLSISSSSNTFYYPSLKAGKIAAQTIGMKALSNGDLSAGTVTINFSYEYVSGGERQTKTSTESLNVPLFMPDRFSVAIPEMQYGTTGQECSVSLSYVNKGKGAVSNVEAQLVYGDDEVSCELPHQNLGNFESGASGSIDFVFTPNNAGELKIIAKITYEDEMQETKTLEIPITLTVEDFVPEEPGEGGEMGEGEESGVNKKLIIGISAGAVVLIAAAATTIVVVVKRKKKAKKESIPEDFDWNQDTQASSEEGAAAEVTDDENP